MKLKRSLLLVLFCVSHICGSYHKRNRLDNYFESSKHSYWKPGVDQLIPTSLTDEIQKWIISAQQMLDYIDSNYYWSKLGFDSDSNSMFSSDFFPNLFNVPFDPIFDPILNLDFGRWHTKPLFSSFGFFDHNTEFKNTFGNRYEVYEYNIRIALRPLLVGFIECARKLLRTIETDLASGADPKYYKYLHRELKDRFADLENLYNMKNMKKLKKKLQELKPNEVWTNKMELQLKSIILDRKNELDLLGNQLGDLTQKEELYLRIVSTMQQSDIDKFFANKEANLIARENEFDRKRFLLELERIKYEKRKAELQWEQVKYEDRVAELKRREQLLQKNEAQFKEKQDNLQQEIIRVREQLLKLKRQQRKNIGEYGVIPDSKEKDELEKKEKLWVLLIEQLKVIEVRFKKEKLQMEEEKKKLKEYLNAVKDQKNHLDNMLKNYKNGIGPGNVESLPTLKDGVNFLNKKRDKVKFDVDKIVKDLERIERQKDILEEEIKKAKDRLKEMEKLGESGKPLLDDYEINITMLRGNLKNFAELKLKYEKQLSEMQKKKNKLVEELHKLDKQLNDLKKKKTPGEESNERSPEPSPEHKSPEDKPKTPGGKGPDGKGPNGKGPGGKGPDGKGPDGKGPDGNQPDSPDKLEKFRQRFKELQDAQIKLAKDVENIKKEKEILEKKIQDMKNQLEKLKLQKPGRQITVQIQFLLRQLKEFEEAKKGLEKQLDDTERQRKYLVDQLDKLQDEVAALQNGKPKDRSREEPKAPTVENEEKGPGVIKNLKKRHEKLKDDLKKLLKDLTDLEDKKNNLQKQIDDIRKKLDKLQKESENSGRKPGVYILKIKILKQQLAQLIHVKTILETQLVDMENQRQNLVKDADKVKEMLDKLKNSAGPENGNGNEPTEPTPETKPSPTPPGGDKNLSEIEQAMNKVLKEVERLKKQQKKGKKAPKKKPNKQKTKKPKKKPTKPKGKMSKPQKKPTKKPTKKNTRTKKPQKNPAKNPEKNPKKNPEKNPKKNPEKNPKKNPEKNPKKNPEKNPKKNPENNSEENPDNEPGKENDDPGSNEETADIDLQLARLMEQLKKLQKLKDKLTKGMTGKPTPPPTVNPENKNPQTQPSNIPDDLKKKLEDLESRKAELEKRKADQEKQELELAQMMKQLKKRLKELTQQKKTAQSEEERRNLNEQLKQLRIELEKLKTKQLKLKWARDKLNNEEKIIIRITITLREELQKYQRGTINETHEMIMPGGNGKWVWVWVNGTGGTWSKNFSHFSNSSKNPNKFQITNVTETVEYTETKLPPVVEKVIIQISKNCSNNADAMYRKANNIRNGFLENFASTKVLEDYGVELDRIVTDFKKTNC